MPRQRKQIDAHLLHAHGYLADPLSRVAVVDDALLLGQLSDLAVRLDGSNLVIGRHNRDENGLVGNGLTELIQTNGTVTVHPQVSDSESPPLQGLAAIQDRPVLGAAGNDMIALVPVSFRDTFDRQVVGLRGAAGKNNLPRRRGLNNLRNLLARLVHGRLRLPAKGMAATGRVAELFTEVGQHGLEHSRVNGGGGMVIQINRDLHFLGLSEGLYIISAAASPLTDQQTVSIAIKPDLNSLV